MKKEIKDLLDMKNGVLRLNSFAYLRRWQEDAMGYKVDRLTINFDSINHVRLGLCVDCEIKARDIQDIIDECSTKIEEFLGTVAKKSVCDLKAGYGISEPWEC